MLGLVVCFFGGVVRSLSRIRLFATPWTAARQASLFPYSLWGSTDKNWRRTWRPTPASLPGESHGQRSLAGLQSTGSQESGTTE